MSSQSLNDRITAARLSIAGQGLAKSVCKATTEEVIGPKKKHLDYLLHCTNEPNVSIPQMANCLIERTNNTSWVVVFKALITVHHLMCYGNERFTQYLASSNCSIQLSSFLDKAGVQGYDMSTFIRRYAKYLNEKALSYRTVAFDFCKVKRGKEDGILRTMNAEKLLKTLPILQNQLDALLEFDCTANELTNGVINTAFMLLFRDLIRLFACYNDGIINLLEKYFDMNKKMCRDALDIYKKFLIRMDRVAEALKVAANVGIDKGDIPDLTKAPSSLLDALEQHLAALEGKKGAQSGGATTPTQSTAGRQSSVKNGVLALSHTSSAFGTAAAASAGPRQSGVNGTGFEEDNLKKLALEEEEAILELHKERRIKELQTQSHFQGKDISSSTANTNPFLSSPGTSVSNNFIGSPPHTSELGGITSAKASDDLLCLTNNPFSDTMTDNVQSSSANLGMFWNDQNGLISPSTSGNAFVSDASFSAIFGNSPASSAVGKSKPDSATATEGVSGSEKGVSCDLTIPGLNPFATISSTTPSPSIPFEFGGPGTTPILGTLEPQGFFDDFGGASSLGVDGNDPAAGRKSVPEPVPSTGLGFDGQSATSGDILSICGGSLLSRPVSPSAGVHAPKSTPVSSPAPQSLLGDVDAFGEFPFRKPSGSDYSAQTSTFDLGASSVQQAFVPFAEPASTTSLTLGLESVVSTKPTPSTALDDLNAVIKAALTNAPTSSNISSGSSLSSKGPADDASAYDMLNVNAKKNIGFGSPSKIASEFDAFGEILQPVSSTTAASSTGSSRMLGQSKVITGDLDSSLASLAQNLSINRSVAPLQKSGNLWNSPKSSAKTGGANWTPQIASSTSQSWSSPQHKYQSLSSTSGRPADWSSGMMAGHFPQAGQSAPANTGLIMGSGAPLSQPPLGVQTAKGFTVPGTFMTPVSAGQQFQPSPQKQQNAPLDPFGAL